MDIILHIGAHRCTSTSFQHYLRMNQHRLAQDRIGYWGPPLIRNGVLRALQPGPCVATCRDQQRRAVGRVQLNLARMAQAGMRALVLSDANMIGTMRENLRGAGFTVASGNVWRAMGLPSGTASAM